MSADPTSETQSLLFTFFQAVFLVLVMLAPQSVWSRDIVFSKEIPKEQIIQLQSDLTRHMAFAEDLPTLRDLMGIKDLSHQSMMNWLTDRVGYIIGESEDYDTLLSEGGAFKYQNPGLFPNFEKPETAPKTPLKLPMGGLRVGVVMTNIGTQFYYHGKEKNILMTYAFDSGEERIPIEVKTPRAGIIQIGGDLFNKRMNDEDPNALSNSIYRLAILFHEAHHSDGNGKSLGFPHAVCPKGSPYHDTNSCDRNTNGPYAVEEYFVRQALVACQIEKSCSEDEVERLSFIGVDLMDRIIDDTAVWDVTPEGL